MKHLILATVGVGVALLTVTHPLDAQSVRVEASFRSSDAGLRIAYESRGSSWLRSAPGVGVDCGRCETPGFRWKQLKKLREHERERWKNLREHERERLKDLREAEREYLKDVAESHREWRKDQREREREFLKREREERRGPHQRGPRR